MVRSWCARRARIAFQEALKQQGFDKLGTPLSVADSDQQNHLKGTFELIIRPPFVNQAYEAVLRDANHLLENILKKRAINRERAITHPLLSPRCLRKP